VNDCFYVAIYICQERCPRYEDISFSEVLRYCTYCIIATAVTNFMSWMYPCLCLFVCLLYCIIYVWVQPPPYPKSNDKPQETINLEAGLIQFIRFKYCMRSLPILWKKCCSKYIISNKTNQEFKKTSLKYVRMSDLFSQWIFESLKPTYEFTCMQTVF